MTNKDRSPRELMKAGEKYVFLEKFLKVKEKIIENFTDHNKKLSDLEKKLKKTDKKIYKQHIATLIVYFINVLIIAFVSYMYYKLH